MGRKKEIKMPTYMYANEHSGKFVMLPPDLFETDAFQKLSHAARAFYLCLAAHKASDNQRSLLWATLKEYNELFGWGKPDIELSEMAGLNTKQQTCSRLFVIPDKHLKDYGYSPQYAYKLKKELIDKGFIKVKWGGKGKEKGWDKNVTVYEFSNEWKKIEHS